jgi:hypothetical protein
MANKKMTKKEMFAQLKANYDFTAEEIAFIDNEIKLLENRNSKGGTRKPTEKQKANVAYKELILAYLSEHSEEKFTVTELWKNIPDLADNEEMSNQRVSALVRQLKEDNLIKKEEIKRKAYFSIVE